MTKLKLMCRQMHVQNGMQNRILLERTRMYGPMMIPRLCHEILVNLGDRSFPDCSLI